MRLQFPWETRAQYEHGTAYISAVAENSARDTTERELKSSLTLGLSDELGSFLIAGALNAKTPSAALNLYDKSTTVTVPINWIAELFAQMEPVLWDVRAKEMTTDHPLLAKLREPSPYYSRVSFFEKLAKDFLITGETGLVATGSTNAPPAELQPVSPAEYSPNEENGVPRSFTVTGATMAGEYVRERDGNRVRYFRDPLSELATLRGYSTKGNGLLRADSPLLAAAHAVRQHVLGGEHNVSILEKGGRISLLFHFAEDIRDKEFTEIKKRIRAAYGGPTHAGEIAVTTGKNLDIKELGVNPKDMDFKNLSEMARAEVLLQYRMPLALAFLEATTLDNYGLAKLSVYDDAALPLATRLFGFLACFLMPRYGLDPQVVELRPNLEVIPALVERVLSNLERRRKVNIETDDELRRAAGLGKYEGVVDGQPGSSIRDTAARVTLEEITEEEDTLPPVPPPPPDPDD